MTYPIFVVTIIGLSILNAAVAMAGLRMGLGLVPSMTLAALAAWVGWRMVRARCEG